VHHGQATNWKREPWVWMLISIPLAAVIMGVVMITLAINTWSGLVVDDYYQQGKHINRVLARDRRAFELGLAADLAIGTDGVVTIRFDPARPAPPGDDIELSLVHATRPGLDRSLQVHRIDSRLFTADLVLLGQGRWNVYLQTPDWRLTGSWHSRQPNRVSLLPNYSPE